MIERNRREADSDTENRLVATTHHWSAVQRAACCAGRTSPLPLPVSRLCGQGSLRPGKGFRALLFLPKSCSDCLDMELGPLSSFISSPSLKTLIFIGVQLVSLVAQTVKHLPAVRETRVRFLGREDPLEKERAVHSSTLAWRIPWTEEPDRLWSMGSQRVGHD